MFERIVVGVDGSESSREAVCAAAEIAAACGGTVHLVTAEEPELAINIQQLREELPEEFHSVLDAHPREHSWIEDAVFDTRQRGAAIERHFVSGDPVDCLIDIAEKLDADLVVVGSRGLGRGRSVLLGSVSYGLAHHLKRPLLIIRHPQEY